MKHELDDIELLYKDLYKNDAGMIPSPKNKEQIYSKITFTDSNKKDFLYFFFAFIGILLVLNQLFFGANLTTKTIPQLAVKEQEKMVNQIEKDEKVHFSKKQHVAKQSSNSDQLKKNTTSSFVEASKMEQEGNILKISLENDSPSFVSSDKLVETKNEAKVEKEENPSVKTERTQISNNKVDYLPIESMKEVNTRIPFLEEQVLPTPSKSKSLRLTLYLGQSFTNNNLTENIEYTSTIFRYTTINERQTFHLSLENEFRITSHFGISLGLSLDRSMVIYTDESLDTNFIYKNEEYLVYENKYSIPVSISFSSMIYKGLGFRFATGAYLSYQKNRIVSNLNTGSDNLLNKDIGYRAFFRTELDYSFPEFSIGIYGKYSYDFKPNTVLYEMERSRQVFQLGIILKKEIKL